MVSPTERPDTHPAGALSTEEMCRRALDILESTTLFNRWEEPTDKEIADKVRDLSAGYLDRDVRVGDRIQITVNAHVVSEVPGPHGGRVFNVDTPIGNWAVSPGFCRVYAPYVGEMVKESMDLPIGSIIENSTDTYKRTAGGWGFYDNLKALLDHYGTNHGFCVSRIGAK